MAELNPPVVMQNRTDHSALTIRTLADSLTSGSAVVGVSDLKVTQRAAGVNMSVDVAGGLCFIEGTETATQGAYCCRSDATPTNVAIAASSPTLPRIDIIVAKVQDAFYSGATNAWSIVAVTGTAAASPTAPTAPVNSLILAQVSVAANATTVVNANITDKRVIAAGRLYTGDYPCTSTTRPAVPWTGLTIYESDTKNQYLWDGTAWQLTGKVGAQPYAMAAGTVSLNMSAVSNVNMSVTFPTSRFSVAPIVMATHDTAGAGTNAIILRAFSISTTGCSINAATYDLHTVTISGETVAWQAIQMTTTTAAG
jgi:hypothetical protein